MKPKKPLTAIEEAGRQRVCNLMALFGVSHATVYRWIDEGKLPRPDGKMGRSPYWLNETLRPYVSAAREGATSKQV